MMKRQYSIILQISSNIQIQPKILINNSCRPRKHHPIIILFFHLQHSIKPTYTLPLHQNPPLQSSNPKQPLPHFLTRLALPQKTYRPSTSAPMISFNTIIPKKEPRIVMYATPQSSHFSSSVSSLRSTDTTPAGTPNPDCDSDSSVSDLTCRICNKTYSRKDNLKTHQRVHTQEKPYPCSMCPKRFRWAGTLTNHEKVHRRRAVNDASMLAKRPMYQRSCRSRTSAKRHSSTLLADKVQRVLQFDATSLDSGLRSFSSPVMLHAAYQDVESAPETSSASLGLGVSKMVLESNWSVDVLFNSLRQDILPEIQVPDFGDDFSISFR